MNPATLLEHDGLKQPISEWALDYGITSAIIIGRLERGETVEAAIMTPMKIGFPGQRLPGKSKKAQITDPLARQRSPYKPRQYRPGHNTKLIEHDGLSLTISEWSQRSGVSVGTIYGRLHLGWPISRAITPGDQRRRVKRRVGRAHDGIHPDTVKSRLRRGWPLELAMSEPPRARMGRHAHGRPGVSPDFAPFEGTGGGSTLQESPNITFSEKA